MASSRPIPPALRVPLALLAVLQLTLFVLARRDLRRRPDDQIRGSRRWWRRATFLNTVGPAAYFAFGRRRA
ncbi:hypothetical protein PAI11_26950 [Patulibacter medicamentivorans]|uniref:Cardiolipin synthase N-terminal domain-containing protein n=1 Tax=Patulibacter medicamentivorans TaxID=1097667 RepID=H0E793_9ACTN|nr:hypothetical protein [Patulibacter medicamentivorans]EHN10468.1 hypothetical protein PAI11_26950 [Patulibacter medicamentivorans]